MFICQLCIFPSDLLHNGVGTSAVCFHNKFTAEQSFEKKLSISNLPINKVLPHLAVLKTVVASSIRS